MPLQPGMRERADFVGAYIHDRYRGGGREETARLMREAQAAYADRGTRENPSESVGEEIGTAALGTIIGLLALSAVLIALRPRPPRPGCPACQKNQGGF